MMNDSKDKPRIMDDLTLKNGATAEYLAHDDWQRPVYKIRHKGKNVYVCCPELNGTYLHTYSPFNDWRDGEPNCPLKDELQPVDPHVPGS